MWRRCPCSSGGMRPVVFQREDGVAGGGGGIRSEEEARVVEHGGFGGSGGIPGALGPYALVDVVMHAVGVSHEPDGRGGVGVVLNDARYGARIDGFAAQHVGERAVEVFLGELAAHVVRQVGIEPDGILDRRAAAFLGDAELGPGTVHDASEIVGLVGLEEIEEGVVLVRFKTLIGDPEFGVGEIAVQEGGQVFQVVQDLQWFVVARIASGHEDRVQARQFLIEGFLGGQFRGGAAGKRGFDGRPEAVIHVVVRANAAQLDVHLLRRGGEMRAGAGGQGVDVFYRVRAEHDKIADVLLVDGLVPGVAGVVRIAIAELVPADRVGRGRRDVRGSGEDGAAGPAFEGAQERSRTEQSAARIVAQHPHDLPCARIFNEERVPLGGRGAAAIGRDGNHRARGGHGGCRGPGKAGALLDLLRQDFRGFRLGRWGRARVYDNHRRGQVDVPGGQRGGIGHVDEALLRPGVGRAAHGDREGHGAASRARVRVRRVRRCACGAVPELPEPARDEGAACRGGVGEGHFQRRTAQRHIRLKIHGDLGAGAPHQCGHEGHDNEDVFHDVLSGGAGPGRPARCRPVRLCPICFRPRFSGVAGPSP